MAESEILILALGTLAFGMILLIKGGDWTIDSSVRIARRFGLSPMLIGFTIVAFGTSLPEMVVSVNANIKDAEGLAFGNVIGSNVANILLILGVSALIIPLRVKVRDLRDDMLMMLFASGLMYGLLHLASLERWMGAGMLLLLVVYTAYRFFTSSGVEDEEGDEQFETIKSLPGVIVTLIGGLAALAFGGELLVRGAVVSARIMEIPESVIGLSLVAVGTSLPELATCAAAAMRRQTDMIIGNVIGSNVFNIMSIIGAMLLVEPISMSILPPEVLNRDMIVMLEVTLAFCAVAVLLKGIPRWMGAIMLAVYVGYIGWLSMTVV